MLVLVIEAEIDWKINVDDASVSIALLGVTIITGIASGAVRTMILKRLAYHHPKIWVMMGSPAFIENDQLKTEFKVFEKFFREKQYLTLNDPILVRECRASEVLKHLLVLEVTAVGLLIAYYAVQHLFLQT